MPKDPSSKPPVLAHVSARVGLGGRPWLLLVPVLLVLLVTGSACGGSSSASSGDPTTLTLRNAAGKAARLHIEVADSPAEEEKGLSGRTNLPADNGMLFVIEQKGPGFWMKDTLIPLSVAFISGCGRIVAIADMQPLSLEIHSTDQDYNFGLEVNQGWFQRHGIAVGDKVEIPRSLQLPGCDQAR